MNCNGPMRSELAQLIAQLRNDKMQINKDPIFA